MIKFYLLILVTVLYNFSVFSQTNTLEGQKTIMPGSSTSVSFKLENKTLSEKKYIVTPKCSNPFIVPLFGTQDISVPQGNSEFYIVAFRIHPEARAGKENVLLEVKDILADSTYTLTEIIKIQANQKIEIQGLEAPQYVRSGDTLYASFIIKNLGNTTESFIISSNLSGINQQSSLVLNPGESKVYKGYKKTDVHLGTSQNFSAILTATLKNDMSKREYNGYNSIYIIATHPEKKDRFFRFPINASVSYLHSKFDTLSQKGFQYEVFGSGSLTKDNRHLLEFKAASPSPIGLNAYTQYEEYFVRYKNDRLQIHLGDQSYASSYLTENARYGRGVDIKYGGKYWTIGGFYNQPRFFKDIKSEWNAFATLKFNELNDITLGYLHKKPNLAQNIPGFHSSNYLKFNAHLPYIKSKIQLHKNIIVQSEIALSATDSTKGWGYMLQGQATFKKWYAHFMYLGTSPNFAGYYSNASTFNGNASYHILKNLRFSTVVSKDARNINNDTLWMSAPLRTSFQYGLLFEYDKSGRLFAYNGWSNNEDRRTVQQFNYKENFYRIGIEQNFWLMHFRLESQLGKTKNLLTGYSGASNFYTANLGVTKFNTTLNVNASIGKTSRYQQANQKQLYYGASIFSQLSTNTSFNIFYQNNYSPEDYYRDRNLFEASFKQEFFKNHTLSLSGRYTLQKGSTGNKDFIVALRYTLRLNVPVQKIARYTSVSGRFNNMGVNQIEGIKLKLGNQIALTDKAGNFIFKNVIPGDYTLEMDRSNMDMNAIAETDFPTYLNLGEKDTVIHYNLTTAGNIKGKVAYKEIGALNDSLKIDQNNIAGNNGANSIIIELSNDKQVFRKICNLDAEFDFTYLRPGSWKVKVYRNGLDKKYKINTTEFDIDLSKGETRSITIQVVKQQKQIQFQQESIKIGYNQK
ncbi:MAG: hypothetical protein E6Q95_05645 [Chitinophagaceae bacterium]|nr:MAG: hypothetical protein E6Q95_05645 [Chitinophagaceae bacterium]